MIRRIVGTLVLTLPLGAAVLNPSSYDMNNGHGVASSGSFNYWDLNYSGAGATNVDNAALSGGLGDLTDDVIAGANWIAVENVAGTGPYVGWRMAVLAAPTITFHFAGPVTLNSVTLWLDDSNGVGGVDPPLSVDFGLFGGALTNYAVADPAGGAPFSFVIPGLALSGSDFTLRLNYRNEWIFLSEVDFDGVAEAGVPEPATFWMLAAGVGLFAIGRRRAS